MDFFGKNFGGFFFSTQLMEIFWSIDLKKNGGVFLL